MIIPTDRDYGTTLQHVMCAMKFNYLLKLGIMNANSERLMGEVGATNRCKIGFSFSKREKDFKDFNYRRWD